MESAKINGAQRDFKILEELSANFSDKKNVAQAKTSGIFFKMTGKHNVAVQSVEKGKWLPWKKKDYRDKKDFETSTAFVKGLVENVLRHKDDFSEEQLKHVFTFIEQFNEHVADRAEEIYKTKDVGEKVEFLSIRDVDIALADLTSDFSRICNEKEIGSYLKKSKSEFINLYENVKKANTSDEKYDNLAILSAFVHKFDKDEQKREEIHQIRNILYQFKLVLPARQVERRRDVEFLIDFCDKLQNNFYDKNDKELQELEEMVGQAIITIHEIVQEYIENIKLDPSKDDNKEIEKVVVKLKTLPVTSSTLSQVLKDFRELFQLLNKRQF